MRKIAILLGLVLMMGAIVPFISFNAYATHNGSHIVDVTSSNELVNGSIVYVNVHSSEGVNFDVRKSPGAEVMVSELPGATFLSIDPNNPNLLRFSWAVSDLPNDVNLPAGYSVTFTTFPAGTSPSPEVKNILIVFESKVPDVKVMFDRTGYLVGDTATIIVNDTHANLYDSFDFDEDGDIDNIESIQVEIIRMVGTSGTSSDTVLLQESDQDSGIFVGEYSVPSGDLIKAVYKGRQDSANIGLTMWIEDNHYVMGDEAKLVITDLSKATNGINDRITVKAISNAGTTRFSLDEKANSGIFEVMVEPDVSSSRVADIERVAADVGDKISLIYRNQIVQATVIEPVFNFDREWYANSEFATITVVDKDENLDKHARDRLAVEVMADNDPAPITTELIESGPDTATFHSYEMVLITNNTQVANNHPFAVFAREGDTITATYSGKVAETVVGIPAAIDASPTSADEGAGESGITPNDAQIIFPGITNLSCGSFGDTDTDGLCDNWENGSYLKITYGGTLHTFTESCSPCASKTKKDIYLEVDYDSTIAGYPGNLTTALTNIKNVFATAPVPGSAGVVLHYYVDDPLSSLPEDVKIWSDAPGNPTSDIDSYTEIKQSNFGLVPTWSANKDKAWHNAVHYALAIKDQAHDQGSSGIAELVGDDIVMSLFGFANSVDQIQGTLMHELGHNLGLKHGGGLETFPPTPGPPETYDWFVDSETNCKPNYPSVMSYDRQFTNMFAGNTLNYSPGSLTVGGMANAPLNVSSLSEIDGVRPPSGSPVTIVYGVPNLSYDPPPPPSSYIIDQAIGPGNPVNFPRMPIVKQVTNTDFDVDWNNDHDNPSIDTGVSNTIFDISILRCDVGSNPIPAGKKIYDHNDWSSLLMNFRYYNPDSLLTGSRIMDSEMSEIGWELVKVHGVADLDRAIQDLDDGLFFEGIDEAPTDSVPTIQFAGSGVDVSSNPLPVPPPLGSATADLVGNTTVTTLTVTDPDKNIVNNTEDPIPFLFGSSDGQFTIEVTGDGFNVMIDNIEDYTGASCLTFSGVCLDDILPDLPDLSETGDSTGIFDDDLEFVNGGLDVTNWQALTITFNYHDADGDQVSAAVKFKGHDGEVSVSSNTSNVTSGTTLTITVEDIDLNLDDSEVDEFQSSIAVNDDALLTVETKNHAIGGVSTEIFTETGANTGIFTADFVVGTDIPSDNATRIVVTYNDEIDSNGSKDEREVNLPIGSPIGPGQAVVHDMLMVQDGSNPSVAANVQRFGNPAGAVDQLQSIMIGIDGIVGGDQSDDWLSQRGQTIVTPKALRLLAVLEQVELNEPYLPGTKMFSLTSHYNNTVYTILAEGETITPIVNNFVYDPSKKQINLFLNGQGNLNVTIPNAISDSFTQITILRTGEEVEFEEISSNSTHTVYRLEDLPYYPGPEGVSMSYALQLGDVTVTPVVPKNRSGVILNNVTENTQVVLSTTLKNTKTTEQRFVALIEVRDSNGMTVLLAWQAGVLNALETEVGISWTPEQADDYEVRVFVISDLASPHILSLIESNTVTVVEDTR